MLKHKKLYIILPFIGLLFALLVGIYGFMSFDRYRTRTVELLQKEYPISFTFTRILQYLHKVQGYLIDREANDQVSLEIQSYFLYVNQRIKEILSKSYVEEFISKKNIALLKYLNNVIENEILIELSKNYKNYNLKDIYSKNEYIIFNITNIFSENRYISGEMFEKNDQFASRNLIIFSIFLGLISIISGFYFFILLQRKKVIEERKEYFH